MTGLVALKEERKQREKTWILAGLKERGKRRRRKGEINLCEGGEEKEREAERDQLVCGRTRNATSSVLREL